MYNCIYKCIIGCDSNNVIKCNNPFINICTQSENLDGLSLGLDSRRVISNYQGDLSVIVCYVCYVIVCYVIVVYFNSSLIRFGISFTCSLSISDTFVCTILFQTT